MGDFLWTTLVATLVAWVVSRRSRTRRTEILNTKHLLIWDESGRHLQAELQGSRLSLFDKEGMPTSTLQPGVLAIGNVGHPGILLRIDEDGTVRQRFYTGLRPYDSPPSPVVEMIVTRDGAVRFKVDPWSEWGTLGPRDPGARPT